MTCLPCRASKERKGVWDSKPGWATASVYWVRRRVRSSRDWLRLVVSFSPPLRDLEGIWIHRKAHQPQLRRNLCQLTTIQRGMSVAGCTVPALTSMKHHALFAIRQTVAWREKALRKQNKVKIMEWGNCILPSAASVDRTEAVDSSRRRPQLA